jgi:uncharacterized membrane protein
VPELFGVPLHPALSHFPIAAAVFAAGALLVATLRRNTPAAAWRSASVALLLVAFVTVPFSIFTGREWAQSLALMPEGTWLPPVPAAGGVLRKHVLAVLGASVALLAALPLAVIARHPKRSPLPAFVAAAVAAALLFVAGHMGGRMVHRPVPGQARP